MSIITPFDFKGENRIAQVEALPAVQEGVQIFINKYEPKFLKQLLGDTLAAEFKAGLANDPTNTKWTYLTDGTDIKEMLIGYIYYWYQRSNTTRTAGVSEVKGKTENSTATSGVDKQTRSWNEMVDMAKLFDLSIIDYPSYVHPSCIYPFLWMNWPFFNFGFYHEYRLHDSIYLHKNSLGI